jgi:hypothetical protein
MAPVLTHLIPSNHALVADFINSPYLDLSNAFITIVNSDTNVMSNIYLTEEEALAETYTISGLTNGILYYVNYTQVRLTPDAARSMSDTLSATPCTVPSAPELVSVVYVNGTIATATVILPANTSGSVYQNITFLLLDETTGAISQQVFTPVSPVVLLGTSFTLTNLIATREYIISCQLVNSAGYSPLSNSVDFLNSVGVPVAPVLNDVVSGYDQAVQLVFTPISGSVPLILATAQYQLVTDVAWTPLGTYSLSGWASGQQISVLSSAFSLGVPLTNGSNYNFRCYVTAVSASPPSSVKTGVPALMNSFSGPTLTVQRNGTAASGLISGWDFSTGTFLGPTVTSVFTYNVGGAAGTQTLITHAELDTALLPIVNLTLGSACSVVMTLRSVIPPANQPYWLNRPADNIIVYSSTLSANSTVTYLPDPVTNISYISGAQTSTLGRIQFFWDEPIISGGTPITNYTLKLYSAYPSGQDTYILGTTIGPVENYTFSNLSLDNPYWVTISANNALGSSALVTYPSVGYSGIYITQPIVAVPVPSLTQTSPTAIEIAWTMVAPPGGQTYNNFNVYSIAPNGVQTNIATQSYVSNVTDYYFSALVSSVPASHTFGVVLNATITNVTPNYAASSLMGLATIQSSGAPTIGVPTFYTTGGLGSFTVVINTNGSDIIPDGAMFFVVPTTAGPNPVNFLTPSQIDAINAGPQPYTLNYNLSYPITVSSTSPGYLFSISNGAGATYAYSNLG